METLEHAGGGVVLPASTGRLRRLLWLLVLVVGIVAYQVVLWVMVDTMNVNFVPTLLLIGATTVPVSVLVFAQTGGRTVLVTPWVVATTAIVGGLVGTMGCGFQTLLSAGSLSAVDDTLLLRALLAPACHIAWTGMCTATLWRIHSAPDKALAAAAFVGTYLAAVALHATWDGSTSIVVHTVVAGIGLIVLLGFLRRAHHMPRDASVAATA